jgi:hypothetical protein
MFLQKLWRTGSSLLKTVRTPRRTNRLPVQQTSFADPVSNVESAPRWTLG